MTIPKGLDVVGAAARAGTSLPPSSGVSEQDLLLESLEINIGPNTGIDEPETDEDLLFQSLDPSFDPLEPISPEATGITLEPVVDPAEAEPTRPAIDPLKAGMVFDWKRGFVDKASATPDENIRSIQILMNGQFQGKQRADDPYAERLDTPVAVSGNYDQEFLESMWQLRQEVLGMSPEEARFNPRESGNPFGANDEDAKIFFSELNNEERLEGIRPVGADWIFHPQELEGAISEIEEALVEAELAERGALSIGEEDKKKLKQEIRKALDVYRVAGAGNWTHVWLDAQNKFEAGTADDLDTMVRTLGPRLLPTGAAPGLRQDEEFNSTIERMKVEAEFASGQKSASDALERQEHKVDPNIGYSAMDEERLPLIHIPETMFSFNDRSRSSVRDTVVEWSKDPKAASKEYTAGFRNSARPIRKILLDFPGAKTEKDQARTPERVRAYNLFMYPAVLLDNPGLLNSQDIPTGVEDSREDLAARSTILGARAGEISKIIGDAANAFPDKELADDVLLSPAALYGFHDADDAGVTRGDRMSRDDRLLYLIALTSVDGRQPTFGGGGHPELAAKFGDLNSVAVKRNLIRADHREAYSGDRGGYFKQTFDDWTKAIEKGQDPMDSDELKDSMLLALSALHDSSNYGQLLRYGIALESLNAKIHGQDSVLMWENERNQPGPNPSVDDSVKGAFARAYRPISALLTSKVAKDLQEVETRFIKQLDFAYDYVTAPSGFGKMSSGGQLGELVVESASKTLGLDIFQHASRLTIGDATFDEVASDIMAGRQELEEKWSNPERRRLVMETMGAAPISDIGASQRALGPSEGPTLPGPAGFWKYGVETGIPSLLGSALGMEEGETPKAYVDLMNMAFTESGVDQGTLALLEPNIYGQDTLDRIALERRRSIAAGRERHQWDLLADHILDASSMDDLYAGLRQLTYDGMPQEARVGELTLEHMRQSLVLNPALKDDPNFMRAMTSLEAGDDHYVRNLPLVLFSNAVIDEITNLEALKKGAKFRKDALRLTGDTGIDIVSSALMGAMYDEEYVGGVKYQQESTIGWGMRVVGSGLQAPILVAMQNAGDLLGVYDKPITDDSAGFFDQWAAQTYLGYGAMEYAADFIYSHDIDDASGTARALRTAGLISDFIAPWETMTLSTATFLPRAGLRGISVAKGAPTGGRMRGFAAGSSPTLYAAWVNTTATKASDKLKDSDYPTVANHAYKTAADNAQKAGINPVDNLSAVNREILYEVAEAAGIDRDTLRQAQKQYQETILEKGRGLKESLRETYKNPTPEMQTVRQAPEYKAVNREIDKAVSQGKLDKSQGAVMKAMFEYQSQVASRFPLVEVQPGRLVNHLPDGKTPRLSDPVRLMRIDTVRGEKFGIIPDSDGLEQPVPIGELFVENPKGQMMFPGDFYRAVEVRSLDERAPASLPKGALAAGLELPGSTEVFFSAAERALAQSWPKGANNVKGRSLLNKIQGRAKKAEIKTMGLDKFLMSKERFTFEEVYSYITRERLRVDLLVKGVSDLRDKAFESTIATMEERFANLKSQLELDFKKGTPEYEAAAAEYLELGREIQNMKEQLASGSVEWTGREAARGQYSQPGGANPREFVIRAENAGNGYVPTNYHFTDPGVLFFIQTTDRIDADGNKYICIETIQSDWHQQYNKKFIDRPPHGFATIRDWEKAFINDADQVLAGLEDALTRGGTSPVLSRAELNRPVMPDRSPRELSGLPLNLLQKDLEKLASPPAGQPRMESRTYPWAKHAVELLKRAREGHTSRATELMERGLLTDEDKAVDLGLIRPAQDKAWALDLVGARGELDLDKVDERIDSLRQLADESAQADLLEIRDLLQDEAQQLIDRDPSKYVMDRHEGRLEISDQYRSQQAIDAKEAFAEHHAAPRVGGGFYDLADARIAFDTLYRSFHELSEHRAEIESGPSLARGEPIVEPGGRSSRWAEMGEIILPAYQALDHFLDFAPRIADNEVDLRIRKQIWSESTFASPHGALEKVQATIKDPRPPLSPSLWEGTAIRFITQRAAREGYDGLALVNADDLAVAISNPMEEGFDRILNGLRHAYNPFTPDGRIGRYPGQMRKFSKRFGVNLEVAYLSKWSEEHGAVEPTPMPTEGGKTDPNHGYVDEADLDGHLQGMPADVPVLAFLDFIENKMVGIRVDDGTPAGGGRRIDHKFSADDLEIILDRTRKKLEHRAADLHRIDTAVEMTARLSGIPEGEPLGRIDVEELRDNLWGIEQGGDFGGILDDPDIRKSYVADAWVTIADGLGVTKDALVEEFSRQVLGDPGGQFRPPELARWVNWTPDAQQALFLWRKLDEGQRTGQLGPLVGPISGPKQLDIMVQNAGSIRNMILALREPKEMANFFDPGMMDVDPSLFSDNFGQIRQFLVVAIQEAFSQGLMSPNEESLFNRYFKESAPLREDSLFEKALSFQKAKPHSEEFGWDMEKAAFIDKDSLAQFVFNAVAAKKASYDRDVDSRLYGIKRFVESVGASIGGKTFPTTAIRFNKKMRKYMEQNPVELWMERGGEKLGKFETRRDPKATPSPGIPKLEVSLTGMRPEFPELKQHWDDYTETKAELDKRIAAGEDPASTDLAELSQSADQYLQELHDLYQPFLKQCLTEDLPEGLFSIDVDRPGFGVWNGDPSEATVLLSFDFDAGNSLARDVILGRLAQFSQVFQQGGLLFREKVGRLTGVTPEMIDGSVPFPENFAYTDAGGVNRAATIVMDVGKSPELLADARPLLDHMAKRYMGATYDPEIGTITIAHTPEWSGQTPKEHLESVRKYLQAAQIENLSVDIDAFRENIYVVEPVKPTKFIASPPKWSKFEGGSLVSPDAKSTPPYGFKEKIYDYETLILHGLEAEQDASRSRAGRDLGDISEDEAAAAPGAALERPRRYPASRSERTGSTSDRFDELKAANIHPQFFAGFNPRGRRKLQITEDTGRITEDPDVPQKTAFLEVGKNDYLMNPPRNQADTAFRELEQITGRGRMNIADIQAMGRKLGLGTFDWNKAMARLRSGTKPEDLPRSLRRFDFKAAKKKTDKNEQVNIESLNNEKLGQFAKYYAYQALWEPSHGRVPDRMAVPSTLTKSEMGDLNKNISMATTPGNVIHSFESLDKLLEEHPNPYESDEAWQRFMAALYGPQEKYLRRPPGVVKYMDPTNINALVGYNEKSRTGLSPRMLAETNEGIAIGQEFKQAYESGEMGVVDTGMLFLWGILSRRMSPFPHESLFMDAALQDVGPFIEAAAQGRFDENMLGPTKEAGPRKKNPVTGKFTETKAKFEARRAAVMATGNTYAAYMQRVFDDITTYGSPGIQARSNLHDFGKTFLLKMSQPIKSGDFAGQNPLQVIHEAMADFSLSGPEVRRRFVEVKNGNVGINLKVVSFVILVAGRTDVQVLDRIQARNWMDNARLAEEYGNDNVYDGYQGQKAGNKQPYEWQTWGNSNGMAAIMSDVRGLAFYETGEAALAKSIQEAYNFMGREGSQKRFHWESWVAISEQEVGHGSLGIILNAAKGLEDPTAGVVARQGKLIEFMYGIEYVSFGGGERAFIVRDSKDKPYIMNREQKDEYIRYARKAIPTGYTVTSDATAWYEYVNTAERDAKIRGAEGEPGLGRAATAEEIRLISDASHGSRRSAEGDAAITGQSDASGGIHGGVSSNGVRQPIDHTGYVLTQKDVERFAKVRGPTPPEMSRAIYNELGVDLLRDADGSMRNTDESLKIYPLDEIIQGKSYPEIVDMLGGMSNDPKSPTYGWKYKEFGPRFESDGTPVVGKEGQLYQRPNFSEFSYKNKHAWLFSPHTSAGSFKDPQYTLVWRATHEIAHGMVDPELTELFGGQGRRAGALGVDSVEQYAVDEYGRPVEFVHSPLSLAQAFRAVEWEHYAFLKQREILEEMGITITKEQFAQEYMINMVDATHRVLTGRFTSPGELGIDISTPPTPEKMLARAKHVIARHAQNRGMDMNTNLTEAARQEFDPRILFMKQRGEVMGMFQGAHAREFDAGEPTAMDSARYILTFFRDADFSVFLHENGHLMAEIMGPEWRDGFFRAGWELDKDGRLTDKGHEDAADAYRYYVETRTAANGRLRYYFDSLWTTGIRDMYYRLRGGPAAENLPMEMKDYWDVHLRPDQRALPRAIKANAERVGDRIPKIRVSDDPIEMKKKGEVERPQKAKEYLKVNTQREDVLQALGLKSGDEIPVNEFVSRSMAYMLTEQTRRAFGAGELVAMTMRTIVPASRVKRIQRDVSDMFAVHCGMPIKAFVEKTADPRTGQLKLDKTEQIGIRAYAEQVAAEPMGRVPGRLINPTSDLTFVSFDEINQLQNAAIDIHAGVAARRDAKAEAVPQNMSKLLLHTLSNVPDYLARKWGHEGLQNLQAGLKNVFQVKDEFGDYISPGIKSEIQAMLRDIGDTQNWFRRTANEVRKAGPHKNKVILKTLDEMRRMLNPPIPVAAGNHKILANARNKFKSLREDGRPTALPVSIRRLTDEDFLAQIRGVFRDGGGYFISESGSTFNEVAALNILTEYGHRLGLSRRAYGEPIVEPGAGPATPLTLTDADTMAIADALDTVMYGLDKRHQLMMDRATEVAIGMGASKDKNVLLALDDGDKLRIYEKFFSGHWGELDAEFAAIETGIEEYKIPKVRRPMLYAELVIRMRAQEVIAKFSERLAQEGLLFTYENLTEQMPVGSVFRDGYIDNVVYFLNQQASGHKSLLVTESGKLLRQGIRNPPEMDYYDPRTDPARKLRRPHAKRAYIDAMEIMRRFGFKSFKGEWTRMMFPDGSEAVVPQMFADAVDMHLEATADIGRAYGSARARTYTTRMMDIRTEGQGPGMPPSQAARLGASTRPGAQVARMRIADAASTFLNAIPGMGVGINIGLTVGPLIVTPAYYAANFLGAFFQTYMKSGFLGMIRAPFANPAMNMAVVKRLWGSNSSAPGDAIIVTKDGRVFTADMLASEAQRRGLDSSFVRAETIESISDELNRTHGSAVRKLASSPRGLINLYTEGATASDNYFRVGLFIDELKNGRSLDAAAETAREALFDYGALTELEKKVFRKVMLFYSFQRKNMDLFFDTLLTNPHRIAGQVRMMSYLQEELLGEESEILLPEYYKARLVAHFREAVVNQATDAGVASMMPMTPIADIMYLAADMADLSSTMAASLAGRELPGSTLTIQQPMAGLLGKLHPYIQAPFVIGMDKDLFWGQELDRSYNVVPNWFVELDQNTTGGFLYDLLKIEPHYLAEDKEYLRPVDGGVYQFRARRGDLWYLLRQAHMVPGLGRSMDTVTQLDRSNVLIVEWTVRSSRATSQFYRDDLGLELPYPAIREGYGNQLDTSLAQAYSEQVSDTMSPRYGMTETEELLQLLGLKAAFIPTLRSAYDKMAREAVYTVKQAKTEVTETPDIEEPR